MAKNSKPRPDTRKDICKMIQYVKGKTSKGWILASDVFYVEGSDGEKIALSKAIGISNENSDNIFLRAKFIQLDKDEFAISKEKWIRWCGPELFTINDLADVFVKTRNEWMAIRPKRKKKVETDVLETELPVIESKTNDSIEDNDEIQKVLSLMYEDFEKQYHGPQPDSKCVMLTHLNVLYETKFIPKSKQDLFKREEENDVTHILETVDIRDKFKPKCSLIVVRELLEELNYFQIVDKNLYQWIVRKPDEEMVLEVHKNTCFNRYVGKHEKDFFAYLKKMGTPVVEENSDLNMHTKINERVASLTETVNDPTINDDPVNLQQFENVHITTEETKTSPFVSEIIIKSDEPDFTKMTSDEKLTFLCESEMRRRKHEEKKAENDSKFYRLLFDKLLNDK